MIRSVGFRLSQGLPPLTRPVLASMTAERVQELYVGNRQRAEMLRKELQEAEKLDEMFSSDLGSRTTALAVIPYSGTYEDLSHEKLDELYKSAQSDVKAYSSLYESANKGVESEQKFRDSCKKILETLKQRQFCIEQEIAKRGDTFEKALQSLSSEEDLSKLSDTTLRTKLRSLNSKIERIERLAKDPGAKSGEKEACQERIKEFQKARGRCSEEMKRRGMKFESNETEPPKPASKKPDKISLTVYAIFFTTVCVGCYAVYKIFSDFGSSMFSFLDRTVPKLGMDWLMIEDSVVAPVVPKALNPRAQKIKDAQKEIDEILTLAVSNADNGQPYSKQLKALRKLDNELSMAEYLDQLREWGK